MYKQTLGGKTAAQLSKQFISNLKKANKLFEVAKTEEDINRATRTMRTLLKVQADILSSFVK